MYLRELASLCALSLTLSACHHPPQTAAELLDKLPRQYNAEIHLQGEAETQPVRLEARQLAVRSEHLLEFSGVNVVVLNPNGSVVSERLAATRGTISAPGFEIKIEDLGAPGGAEDMLKAGTFAGKLSDDLRTGEASWTTGFGTKGSLKLKAIP